MQTRDTVEGLYNSFHLRTSLCKNQTSWEMKFSTNFKFCMQLGTQGGCTKIKSSVYHPDSECCTFFHGNLSNPKSSEDTLIYLYVIWNMLKSADLHESILTPVICHKHVRYHDGVTLYFSMKFPSVAPKKTRNGYFSYMSADFRFLK